MSECVMHIVSAKIPAGMRFQLAQNKTLPHPTTTRRLTTKAPQMNKN